MAVRANRTTLGITWASMTCLSIFCREIPSIPLLTGIRKVWLPAAAKTFILSWALTSWAKSLSNQNPEDKKTKTIKQTKKSIQRHPSWTTRAGFDALERHNKPRMNPSCAPDSEVVQIETTGSFDKLGSIGIGEERQALCHQLSNRLQHFVNNVQHLFVVRRWRGQDIAGYDFGIVDVEIVDSCGGISTTDPQRRITG